MSAFSEKIKTAIEQSGVPIGTLAERSGMSASMLYKIQSGARLPDSLDTLLRLMNSMVCDLLTRKDLEQAYRIERIGNGKYACFNALKQMLADFSEEIQPEKFDSRFQHTGQIPETLIGIGNITGAIQLLLQQEIHRDGGELILLLPAKDPFCIFYLSQILPNCHPNFKGAMHLFCLRSSASDDALLYNMEAIRVFLPRMLGTEHYDPWYSYLPDPDNGTSLFPYLILTSDSVLQISSDYQCGLFLQDQNIREVIKLSILRLREDFFPVTVARSKADSVQTYLQFLFNQEPITPPVMLQSFPGIVPCLRKEDLLHIVGSSDTFPNLEQEIELFSSISKNQNYMTYFSLEGLERFLDTGVVMEMQGPRVMPLSRKAALDTVEELLRRSRQGKVTPYAFHRDIFNGSSRLSLCLFDSKLLTVCEMPKRNSVFADITEATLSHVLRDYVKSAQTLGDVYSPEETIMMIEQILRRYRALDARK